MCAFFGEGAGKLCWIKRQAETRIMSGAESFEKRAFLGGDTRCFVEQNKGETTGEDQTGKLLRVWFLAEGQNPAKRRSFDLISFCCKKLTYCHK